MHDDDRPRRRSFDRPADRVLPSDGPAPEGRKKLVLAARSVPADGGAAPETPENKADASSKPNPFGAARPVDSSAKIAEAERKETEAREDAAKKELVVLLNMNPIPKEIVEETAGRLGDSALAEVIKEFVDLVQNPSAAMDYIIRVRHKLQLIKAKVGGDIKIDMRKLQREAAKASR